MRHALAVLLALLAALALVALAARFRVPSPQVPASPSLSAAPAVRAEEPSVPAFVPVTEVTLPVLVYHHVTPGLSGDPMAREYEITPEELRAQLEWLRAHGYESVTAAQLAGAFAGRGALPERPVMLTFDDGRASQYAHAFPLLRELGFSAVFYVFTNAMDREGYLTWDELREMRDAGMEVGSHTRYHPYLTKETDAGLAEELAVSRDAIAAELGSPPGSLAYPFGLFGEREVRAAAAAGYRTARGLGHGTAQTAENALRLRAHVMPGSVTYLARVRGE